MFAPRVAKRYAQALFESAQEKNVLEEVARDVKDLQSAMEESKELREFVRDPVLAKDEKRLVVRGLFEKKLNGFLFNFLLFLIEKRRLNTLESVCEVFDELYLNFKNIEDVKIISAFPMEETQVEAITKKLRERFSKDVRANVTTDPSLIGGIKLQTQGMVYDFSFKTQLEKFRHSI